MKKGIKICILVLLVFAGLSAKGQSIKNDPNYLRQLNYFWGITSAFAKVRSEYESHSNKVTATKSEQVKVISTLLKHSEDGFAELRTAYPDDKEFKEIEKYRQVLAKSLLILQDGKSQGPPMWQLNYVLVQMSLEDRLME